MSGYKRSALVDGSAASDGVVNIVDMPSAVEIAGGHIAVLQAVEVVGEIFVVVVAVAVV